VKEMKKIYVIFVCAFLTAMVYGASLSALAPKPEKPPGGGKETPPADPEIAYANENDIMVMNADGSNQASVYNSELWPRSPCWSGDGTKIAFLEYGDIWVIDVEIVNGKPKGSNLVQITNNYPTGNSYLNIGWSPTNNNQWVSYQRDTGVILITKNGATVTQDYIYIIQEGRTIETVTRSNDGKKIAFCEWEVEYVPDPYRAHFISWIRILDLTVEPNDPNYVTTVLTNYGDADNCIFRGLGWAKTKDTISFSNSFYTSLGPNGLYTLDLTTSGSTPEYVTSGGGASWSPDDSKMVYISAGKGNTDSIFIIDLSNDDVSEIVKRVEPWNVDWSRA
jgi:Tol biopolymer transport system component